ncbi:MAG: hypothetical protein ABEJ59_05675 [Halanaeroarchaeum sp.]
MAYIPDGLAAILLGAILAASAGAHVYYNRKYRIGERERPPA